MIAWSLSLTPLVVTSRSLEFCSLTFSSSALTSSAVTFVSTFSISTPRYLPSVTSGLTATVAVNKLLEKDFIERDRSGQDRRKVYVSLTNIGIDALNYHNTLHKNIISEITKNLTQKEYFYLQMKTFRAQLQKMTEIKQYKEPKYYIHQRIIKE